MRPIRIFLFALATALTAGVASLFTTGSSISAVQDSFRGIISLVKNELPVSNIVDNKADTIKPTPPVPETKVTADSQQIPLALLRERFNGSDTSLIRIMVFGDSQLEGDRITSRLRTILQEKHGGSGPGLLQPLMPVLYTKTVEIRPAGSWKRYTYLSWRDGEISHRRLGPFMSFCRFLPPDSVSNRTVTASVRVTPSVFASERGAVYDRLRLFYGNLNGYCEISVDAAGLTIAADSLIRGEGPFEYSVDAGGCSDIRITFTGTGSPDIYGFSLESSAGVIVDNIPHRGSAGLEFTLTDAGFLRDMIGMLEPDLIVLHYGLNVVRNVREDYSYYQRGLERQFALLKEVSGGSVILLAGVTDMAASDAGVVRSYPNIDNIRDAQKLAAEASGVIFWDAFAAMGGESSIVRWVEHTPPLAQKDYTHFSYAGSDSLATLLYRSFFVADTAATVRPVSEPSEVIHETEVSRDTVSVGGTGASDMREHIAATAGNILAYNPASPFIFTNLAFWGFLLVLLAGYSAFYRRMAVRNLYLFVFSLFFYWKSGGIFLILLIISTLTDYIAALLIYRSSRDITRRLFLVLSLVVNLGMLGYFKYYEFLIDSVNNLFGTNLPAGNLLAEIANGLLGTTFDVTSVILPVGISFFTFQTISYTFDVYRRKVEPVRNILDFGFYVSFFPQLVAGPIVRASEFIPQLYQPWSVSKNEFGHSLYLIMKGLVKKMIISDFIALNFVDRVFETPELYSGAENLLAVYGYGLQIYCDFSGYTDIAIGVALLLGFRLPVNFNSPYKATGIADFWRRWHISLSRWLKDYLYIPLGGSRRGWIKTGVNLIITMGLGGLWHGASWRFLIWGLLHGFGLVINKIWSVFFPAPLRRRRLVTIVQILLTFNFVSFAWIFFRAESNEMAVVMIRSIFTGLNYDDVAALWVAYPAVILLIFSGYFIHFLPERTREAVRGLFVRLPVVVMLLFLSALALLLISIPTAGVQPFIYFRF